MALVVKKPPASAGDIRDAGLIPWLERSPGEGNSNPLQFSCLGRRVFRDQGLGNHPLVGQTMTLSDGSLEKKDVLSKAWRIRKYMNQAL